ncbi:MAG: aspartate-semialdehyde dehydrogenase [Deltaproteobacteria bacterium]|nr:aspartate-semialdehyde dehydrogenase [Deltaproteobacteria bacterium]
MKERTSPLHFGIVGATGLVGREVLKLLEERNFPIKSLSLFASQRSRGEKLSFRGRFHEVEPLSYSSFDRPLDCLIFSAGADVSREFAPMAMRCGIVVIDNSSTFRMSKEVDLVVPEVNGELLSKGKPEQGRVIANPNCSTIQLVMILKPLMKYGLKRVIVSTYQAVSGAGLEAKEELKTYSLLWLSDERTNRKSSVFAHPIAFSCLPHIDRFEENLYTFEEMKVIHETRKILSSPHLAITCTAVRVPVFDSHSESVNIEFEDDFDVEILKKDLESFKGVCVLDNPSNNVYPLNNNASGRDEVFVGRIRRDESVKSGLNVWVVSDNIRKGAALNAIQIAEKVFL